MTAAVKGWKASSSNSGPSIHKMLEDFIIIISILFPCLGPPFSFIMGNSYRQILTLAVPCRFQTPFAVWSKASRVQNRAFLTRCKVGCSEPSIFGLLLTWSVDYVPRTDKQTTYHASAGVQFSVRDAAEIAAAASVVFAAVSDGSK